MRRGLRWIKRIVLGVLVLAVLAIAIVIGVVHTDWGRNKIRAKIVEQLQGAFPGSTIGSFTGSPFGAVVLHDVRVFAAVRIPPGEPIAASASVHGRWRGKALSASGFAAVDANTTSVPFATLQLGAASVTATGVVLGPTVMTGAVHAELPA